MGGARLQVNWEQVQLSHKVEDIEMASGAVTRLKKLYGIEHDDLYTTFVDALGDSFTKNHRGRIQPLPLYDLDGNLVPITQYESTLYKATLEVVFTLHHFSLKEKALQQKARAYVARPVEITAWDPDSIAFLAVREASLSMSEISSTSGQVPKNSLLLSVTTEVCTFHSSKPEASVYEPCEGVDGHHASQPETAQKLELADLIRQLSLNPT
ncbi:hypothetical protein BJ165DRAFT_1534717 [Panaeolus papilionaceus]|nr:hypothetical protein BJ165DRAFT_1534717 [Panaeolus papilionaceus]